MLSDQDVIDRIAEVFEGLNAPSGAGCFLTVDELLAAESDRDKS